MDQDIERTNRTADQLEKIYRSINSRPYTSPVNWLAEREKLISFWVNGSAYNPQFQYDSPPSNWTMELETYLQANRPESYWEQKLFEDAQQRLARFRSIETHDPKQVTELSIERYGAIPDALINSAYELLDETNEQNKNDQHEPISAPEAARILSDALNKIGLARWNVVVEPRMAAKMNVRGAEQKINIQAGAFFSESQLARLLVHEIGTHVFRYVNGQANPLQILRLGLLDYLATEEGLATYHEERYGLLDLKTKRKYALRVIAAFLSLKDSFYEVFTHLTQFTDPEEAFTIVTRVKRGIVDTSQAGADIKDKVYFEGLRKVSEHLNKFPDDYPLLMSGKISLQMLPHVRELRQAGLICEPRYLPDRILDY